MEKEVINNEIIEKSLKHLRREDHKNNKTTTVPHQILDNAIITPSIITKNFINNILLENAAIFPQDLPIQTTIGKKRIGLMWPRGIANLHPASPLLHQYSIDGCPVDCGTNWTQQQIEAAIQRGPHISAKLPAARQALISEAHEKVKGGYATIITYASIKHALPPKLKISPVAMIPHKSRLYRCILDLSFNINYNNVSTINVNSTTTKMAPQKSMATLGTVLGRLINILALNYNPLVPFVFSKADIKDGFWRMVVAAANAWNFCYTLPPADKTCPIDDIEIVVPHSLQMGWTDSPPYFCSSTETARDIIQWLVDAPTTLPPHPLEHHVCNEAPIQQHQNTTISIVEVYVDDFITATNNLNKSNLQHLARAMLHGIHSIFPPPSITKHTGEDPISIKKLSGGEGVFAFQKEILGWVFDGKNYTLFLTPTKTNKIINTIKATLKTPSITLHKLQKLVGKLMHASIGIPMGKSLLSPAFAAMRSSPPTITMDGYLAQCLYDWITLLQSISSRPTSVLELVQKPSTYIGYVDACGFGAGGVWFSGTSPLKPTVWRILFPKFVIANLVSSKNPTGFITNSDLEMAGLLCQWLVLECIAPASLQHATAGMFSDNTPTVTWANKLSTSTSTLASYLLRALAIRLHVHKANALTAHEAGKTNTMADVTSRSSRLKSYTTTKNSFLSLFSSQFPLPQGQCWTEFRLPSKWHSRVMSCLLGKPLPMAQWTTLPNEDKNIGKTGANTAVCGDTHPSLPTTHHSNAALSPQHSLLGSGRATLAKERQSKLAASQKPLAPSQRPASWLDNQALSTKHTRLTSSQWHGWWKECAELTPLQYHN